MNLKLWEYNVLSLNQPESPKLVFLTKFIRENFNKLEGDYVEIGVFTGKTFITITNLLDQLSTKDCQKSSWGFDTFSGFPDDIRDDERDSPSRFKSLLEDGLITPEHYSDVQRLVDLRLFLNKSTSSSLSHQELSSSKNFDGEKLLESINDKLSFLKLCNHNLIRGDIKHTLSMESNLSWKIFCALIDVDLYQS